MRGHLSSKFGMLSPSSSIESGPFHLSQSIMAVALESHPGGVEPQKCLVFASDPA